jgi:nicotinate-nucleotide adenylyltransferase
MKIGILGGTFDPPHIGHLILASEALDQLSLGQVLWVLTPYPPHKTQHKITTLSHRQRMVELAIEGNPGFTLSRVDIDRPSPHFAVDTMKLLRKQAPDVEYHYLMGLDSLNDLTAWHTPVEFVRSCDQVVVMLRNGESIDIPRLAAKIPHLEAKLTFLRTPVMDISGSDIRSRVASGKPFQYFVPEKVFRYIHENHLYLD